MIRQLKTLAKATGFANLDSCVQWLLAEGPQNERLEKLAQHITIGETYFLRDKQLFSLLKTVVFPERIKTKRSSTNDKIVIWSAGCSSGEEPYSVAITLEETLGISIDKDVRIIASDINSSVLAKARKGVYTSWSFREGSAAFLVPTYFSEAGKNLFQLTASVRKKVSFMEINLLDPVYPAPLNTPGRVDIILCRNVLMYFDQKKRESVVEHFVSLLPPGGWFFVSPAETTIINHPSLERLRITGTYVFRKTGMAASLLQKKFKNHLDPLPINNPIPTKVPPKNHKTVTSSRKSNKTEITPHLDIAASNSADQTLHLIQKAFTVSESGREEEAIEILRGVLEDPRPWFCDIPRQEVMGRLANLYGNCGEYDKGEQMWREAIDEDKINPEPYYHLALTLQDMDRHQESMSYLKKVLFLDPDFLLAHVQLAFICKDRQEALKHANIAYALLNDLPPETTISLSGGMTAGMIKKTLQHIESGAHD